MIGANIDITNWAAKFKKDIDKTKVAIDHTVSKVSDRLFERIVRYTLVGDPSLWNWPAHKDYVPGTLKAAWTLDKTAQEIVIKNETPYAYRVEYEGWSTQAPEGMMRRAIAEYPILIDRTASEYKI